jgi:hypothetical protein
VAKTCSKEVTVKPIAFNPATDVAPIPFEEPHLELARQMKQCGPAWKPHVGCFVWDPEAHIEAESPFPMRIYFVLSLPRFIGIFGSLEAVADKLVWLPTWHQARLLALRLGVEPESIAGLWSRDQLPSPGEELAGIYRLILEAL